VVVLVGWVSSGVSGVSLTLFKGLSCSGTKLATIKATASCKQGPKGLTFNYPYSASKVKSYNLVSGYVYFYLNSTNCNKKTTSYNYYVYVYASGAATKYCINSVYTCHYNNKPVLSFRNG